MPIRNAGGRKCYNLLRNTMNFPMPGMSTMDNEFMCVKAFLFLTSITTPENFLMIVKFRT